MSNRPVRLVDPFITLGETTTGPPATTAIDFTCFTKGIHLTGEEDDALATFCDPNGYSWSLTLDVLMSLGTGSLDEALSKLGGPGTVVPFDFAYTKDAASLDNPHWTGNVRIPAVSIVDAGINEPTEINMEMALVGEISRDDGTGAQVLRASHTHTLGTTTIEDAA